jgi:hypothetical protein
MTADDPFEDDDAGYWPGYVDALTNIVLNLLFMVGVFAVGVFAVSLEARLHQRRAERVAQSAEQTAMAPAARPVPPAIASRAAPDRAAPAPDRAPPPVASPAPTPPRETTPPRSEPAPAETVIAIQAPVEIASASTPAHAITLKFGDSRGNPILQAIFPGDRFSLTESEEVRINSWARDQQARGARSFLLFTSVDESDAQDRRAGYLRIMAVRSSLLRAGIAPGTLSTRMFRGEQRELAANRQVTIVPAQTEQRD